MHAYTLETLKEHLKIKADGYIGNTEMILNVLIKASAENSSLEAACADLEEIGNSKTISEYLNEALPIKELREQERKVNKALACCTPNDLVRTDIESAIDFHDEPF